MTILMGPDGARIVQEADTPDRYYFGPDDYRYNLPTYGKMRFLEDYDDRITPWYYIPQRDTKSSKTLLRTVSELSKSEQALKLIRVIFHDPATIVFWSDGTKTVAKAHNEPYDPEKGLMAAVVKKFMPYSALRKHLDQYRPSIGQEIIDGLNDIMVKGIIEPIKSYADVVKDGLSQVDRSYTTMINDQMSKITEQCYIPKGEKTCE